MDNNSVTWRPTDEQRTVAELLAQGYSQNRIAQIIGIPQQTISGWWNDNVWARQFQALVEDIEAKISQVDITDKSIQTAELVYHQAVTGERTIDDPTVIAARELLAATKWKRKAGEEHKRFGAS